MGPGTTKNRLTSDNKTTVWLGFFVFLAAMAILGTIAFATGESQKTKRINSDEKTEQVKECNRVENTAERVLCLDRL